MKNDTNLNSFDNQGKDKIKVSCIKFLIYTFASHYQ